ncbi:hypothetical protein GIB67_028788 [Kingdonia uniflora]|uniref:PPM-type phosphatase domain-containing protein n=1 Tax=Kingdonia uniflora TaxID=39325 RepID=A0A7J7NCQ8_9MAGN|nr:hypothetical protein GIB67_028788 [Kingdonia uniflora]
MRGRQSTSVKPSGYEWQAKVFHREGVKLKAKDLKLVTLGIRHTGANDRLLLQLPPAQQSFDTPATEYDSRTCVKSSVEMNTQLEKMVALTDGTTIPRGFCANIWDAKCCKDLRKRYQGNNEAIIEMDKCIDNWKQVFNEQRRDDDDDDDDDDDKECSVYSSFVFGALGVNEDLVGEVDLKDFVNRSEQGDFNKEAREILFEFLDKIDVTRRRIYQCAKNLYCAGDYTYEGRRRLMASELDVKRLSTRDLQWDLFHHLINMEGYRKADRGIQIQEVYLLDKLLNVQQTTEHQEMSALVIRKAFSLSVVRKRWHNKPQLASLGSCCLVAIICDGLLYVANTGDSWVVLGRSEKAVREVKAIQLSTEHNASDYTYEGRRRLMASELDVKMKFNVIFVLVKHYRFVYALKKLNILDRDLAEWVKVETFGDHALFIDGVVKGQFVLQRLVRFSYLCKIFRGDEYTTRENGSTYRWHYYSAGFCANIWEAKCCKDLRKRHQGNNEAIIEMDKLYRQLEARLIQGNPDLQDWFCRGWSDDENYYHGISYKDNVIEDDDDFFQCSMSKDDDDDDKVEEEEEAEEEILSETEFYAQCPSITFHLLKSKAYLGLMNFVTHALCHECSVYSSFVFGALGVNEDWLVKWISKILYCAGDYTYEGRRRLMASELDVKVNCYNNINYSYEFTSDTDCLVQKSWKLLQSSQNSDLPVPFWSLVEALKCALSLVALARSWSEEGVNDNNKLSTTWDEVMIYPIPAALYLVKNLLQYYIFPHVDAPGYQIPVFCTVLF